MATPTFFPEGNTPHAGDNIARSLIKINGRLYELAMATLAFLGTLEADCIPHAGDHPQRSLWKINALLNALATPVAGDAGLYSGPGDPNGVISASVGSKYTQTDAPGVGWAKVTGAGNTGWAVET